MGIDLKGTLERYGAVLKEGLLATSSPPPSCDYVTRWFYEQEGTPYFIMRPSAFTVLQEDEDYTEETDVYAYELTARCVVAPYSAGYAGEWDTAIHDWFPQVVEHVSERQLLQSAIYTSAVNHMRFAQVIGGNPYLIFPGIAGAQLLGFEIITRVEYVTEIVQAYV